MIAELEHIEGVYKKIMKERKGIQELSQSVARNFYGMVIMLCLLILLSTIYRYFQKSFYWTLVFITLIQFLFMIYIFGK